MTINHEGNDNFICKQYEIVLITIDEDLEDNLQTVPKTKRLAVLLSPDSHNKYMEHVEVAPLLEEEKRIPTHVKIAVSTHSSLTKPLYLALDRKQTIRSRRIISKVGDLSLEEKLTIYKVLKDFYGIG